MAAFQIVGTDYFHCFSIDNNPLRKSCCILVTIITAAWTARKVPLDCSITCCEMLEQLFTTVICNEATWSAFHSAGLVRYIKCWKYHLTINNMRVNVHKGIVLTGVCWDYIIPFSALHLDCIMNAIAMNHCRRHMSGCDYIDVVCRLCHVRTGRCWRRLKWV